MNVLALAGGVGGAKLADGLYRTLSPNTLTVIGNTADDFVLWGLRISPDLDTVMYTLAGIANPITGWGIADDSWHVLEALTRLGEDTWFRIGDKDFATHLRRTNLLHRDVTLSDATASLVAALGIQARLLPMCDDPVATLVDTPGGTLAFQEYFVRRQHRDAVLGVRFEGIEQARSSATVIDAIEKAQVIVFCPSNPIVSLGPILAVPDVRERIAAARCPRIAVSPLVGGAALKGPADRMMSGLGLEATALGVARLYTDLLDGFVIDTVDAELAPAIEQLGMAVLTTNIIMRNDDDRRRLAQEILQWTESLRTTNDA